MARYQADKMAVPIPKSDVDDPGEEAPITILKTEFVSETLSEFCRGTRQPKAILQSREPRYVHHSSSFF